MESDTEAKTMGLFHDRLKLVCNRPAMDVGSSDFYELRHTSSAMILRYTTRGQTKETMDFRASESGWWSGSTPV